jgi:hypothetical protein
MNTIEWMVGSAMVALSAAGCGGSVVLVDSGDGGALATCGDNCSQSEVAASCAATCNRVAQAGCTFGASGADCTTGCSNVTSLGAACASAAYAYLRCVEPVEPVCTDAGEVEFPGCDGQQQALESCASTSPGTSSGPGVGTTPAPPGSICPDIPRPAGGAGSCMGGGGSSTGGGPPGSPATCSSSCDDGAGDVWESNCTGSTCVCAFNGVTSCTCSMDVGSGICASCCPGTS